MREVGTGEGIRPGRLGGLDEDKQTAGVRYRDLVTRKPGLLHKIRPPNQQSTWGSGSGSGSLTSALVPYSRGVQERAPPLRSRDEVQEEEEDDGSEVGSALDEAKRGARGQSHRTLQRIDYFFYNRRKSPRGSEVKSIAQAGGNAMQRSRVLRRRRWVGWFLVRRVSDPAAGKTTRDGGSFAAGEGKTMIFGKRAQLVAITSSSTRLLCW
jgi:hypothetical protein